MNKKKPDALLILAVLFGLGVLISTITHGGSDEANQSVQPLEGVNLSMYQAPPNSQE
jgi:hypothetical protein